MVVGKSGSEGLKRINKNMKLHCRHCVPVKPKLFKTVMLIWASEASPTLGCSIEISRDIYTYVYVSVCLVCQINCVGGIT